MKNMLNFRIIVKNVFNVDLSTRKKSDLKYIKQLFDFIL